MVAVLFFVNDALTSKGVNSGLYIASYLPGSYGSNNTEGNIVLVNPTSTSYSNLTLAIQVDSSEISNPTLRLWAPNYTLNPPNSFLQSIHLYRDMLNHSTPITTISIEPNQNETIALSFTSQDTFPFNSHNLTIYLSQHSFGDIINGQSLTIPQTEAYIQIVSYSSVQTDYDTYHEYFNATRPGYVYRNDNPNFLQRYFNYSWEIGAANYGMAAEMGVLGVCYFNVTVHNNSSFPVNSVALFGQIPSMGSYMNRWGALSAYVLLPGETYVFPVGEKELPTYAYATGYITNSINSER